jgi:thiol-disulfide isomerase/thioredoxin
MRRMLPVALLCAGQAFGQSMLATEVEQAVLAHNFKAAASLLKQYRDKRGVNAEFLEADSWMARGQLFAENYTGALQNAEEVRNLCVKQLAGRKLDAEPALPAALGATIEVTGQALAGEGRRDEAVVFLQGELAKYRASSIAARIQKNINLLSLAGKPAPALDVTTGLVGPHPRPLSAHSGHPVLLFFWAHWCSDCKAEIPIIERVSKDVDIIAPTQHYGYVAGGVDAPRSAETLYIAKVFAQYYAGLGNVETPLNEANFTRYGVSTTPTIVLINAAGIVKLYHPGAMTYEELAGALRHVDKPARLSR